MSLIAWPSWLHRAWQGQGARLTIARRHPRPVSLQVFIALMAFITWPSSDIVLGRAKGARLTSQKAAAPAPTPRILASQLLTSSPSWSSSLSWPSSHGPQHMAVVAWLHCAWKGEGVLRPSTPFRASGFATQHSFKGSGFCNPTLLLGFRVLQPNTPFRA